MPTQGKLKEEENADYSLREIQEAFSFLWLTRQGKQYLQKLEQNESCSELHNLPGAAVIKDTDIAGISLYGRLIYFGHMDVMTSIYPCCAKLLHTKWTDLVFDYLEAFPPQHYNLNQLAKNLATYLTDKKTAYMQEYPYLAELADYEWLELEKIEEETTCLPADFVKLDSAEAFLTYAPFLNPTLTLRRYAYPIPEIVSYLESVEMADRFFQPEKTAVVIYRHHETHHSIIEEIDLISAQLVEALAAAPTSYAELLKLVLAARTGDNYQEVTLDFMELLEEFQHCGIFIGSYRLTES